MKKRYKYILLAIVIIGIIICIKSCIDRDEADVTVAYIGKNFVQRELFEENQSLITQNCEDISGDGEFKVDIMEISFNDGLSYADLSNSRNKLTMAIGVGEARLYFIERAYLVNHMDKDFFADISSLGEGMKNPDGKTVAISIHNNEKLEKMGIDTGKDMYLAIRIVSELDRNVEKEDNAVWAMAKNILS